MIFEKSIEELLELDFESLKKYLLIIDKEHCKKILSNNKIKEKLINWHEKYEFIWLAQEKNNYIIPYLLEGKGLDILSKTKSLNDKINGIITSYNDYVAELFKNREFVELVFAEHLSYAYSQITVEGAYNFVKELLKMQKSSSSITNIISMINKDAQILVIKNLDLPSDISWDIILNLSPEAAANLLTKSVGKKIDVFTLNQLESLFSKELTFPDEILYDEKFFNNFITMLDIKSYRFLMNKLETSNDVSKITKKRKQFYEESLHSFDEKSGLLPVFQNFYERIKNYITDGVGLGQVFNALEEDNDNKYNIDYFYYIEEYINNIDNINAETLLMYLKKLSNFELTNMIIDYHFKDIYFNVLKDIQILVHFNENGGKSLSEEDLKLYKLILNLDNLSYEDKIKLHEKMKKYNFVEKFYDDIRNAKNLSYRMINESVLNKENINEHRNEEMSKQLGVDIYVLDKAPFKVLVKSFGDKYSGPLTEEGFGSTSMGSFSLDGSDKLETFKDPRKVYNIVYDSFNEEQIIHTFPVDSFTSRPLFGAMEATTLFNQILTPEELVTKSPNYNEILIRQAMPNRPTEYDDKIKKPEMIAIYCYDEITEKDIESAKNLGIGIILVITKNYTKKVSEDSYGIFDQMNWGEELKSNYLKYRSQDAMYGRGK